MMEQKECQSRDWDWRWVRAVDLAGCSRIRHLLGCGQKVRSGFSVGSYRKARTNLLANPIPLRAFNSSSIKWGRIKHTSQGFPGGAVVENLPANAGDTGSSPGLGRSHMPRSD